MLNPNFYIYIYINNVQGYELELETSAQSKFAKWTQIGWVETILLP